MDLVGEDDTNAQFAGCREGSISPLVPPCSDDLPSSDVDDAVKAVGEKAEDEGENIEDVMPPPLPNDPNNDVEEIVLLPPMPDDPSIEARSTDGDVELGLF